MDPTTELLHRKQFLNEYGFSDSTERRRRKAGDRWPPHIWIGNQVYYLRSSVDDWLRQQEASCNSERLEIADQTHLEGVHSASGRDAGLPARASTSVVQQITNTYTSSPCGGDML